jgi:PPOX class probable F420-dependent enzyme
MTDQEARRRFAQARVARLATTDTHHRPHIVPMIFVLVSQTGTDQTHSPDTVYSAVDAKPKRSTSLRRLANITTNPHVAVLADHYEDDWHALWWVRADGTARILNTNEPESRDAITRLVARYPQYHEQPPHGPVIAIDITHWSSWSAINS